MRERQELEHVKTRQDCQKELDMVEQREDSNS